MVELPKVPRRLVTVEEPRAKLSGADIAAPYRMFADAYDKIGDSLDSLAAPLAEQAGYNAVQKGPNGEVEVSRVPIFSPKAASAYDRAVKVKATIEADTEADRALQDLGEQHRNDPEGFRAAATAFRDKRVADLTSSGGNEIGLSVGKSIDNSSMQHYRRIRNESERLNLARTNEAIDTKVARLGDEMETLARHGGVDQPEFASKAADLDALLNEKVKNPLLAFPQEKADAVRDGVQTRAQGAAVLEQMERVYRDGAVDKDGNRINGYEAARDYLKSSVNALGGRLRDASKIEKAGLAWLRSEEAGMRGERDMVRREWSSAKPNLGALGQEFLIDMERRAESLGAFSVAQDIRTSRVALEWVKQFRALPDRERAELAASGVLPSTTFQDRLLQRESGGRADVVNPLGYAGLYQFGAPRLADIGIYNPGSNEDLQTWSKTGKDAPGKWSGTFNIPGFPEVKTLAQFRSNPDAQKAAFGLHQQKMDQEISANGLDRFIGQTVGGVNITRAGLYNAMHLGGAEGTRRLLESGGAINARDPKGTSLLDYARMGQDVDLRQSRAGQVAFRELRKEIGKDVDRRITDFERADRKLELPDVKELETLGHEVAAVGTPEQLKRVAELAAQAQYGAQFREMTPAKRAEVITGLTANMKEGASRFDRELRDKLANADTTISKAFQNDPYGAAYRYTEGYKPLPIVDFGKPEEAAAILTAKAGQQPKIRADQNLPAFSALRPAEQEALQQYLTTADPAAAARAIGTMAGVLPDDVWRATISTGPVKDALDGMVRSYDPVKLDSAMSALDRAWRTDPQGFAKDFGADTLKRLQTWQAWKDSYNPAEIAERFKRVDDPSMAAARKELASQADTELERVTPANIVTQLGKAWPVTPGFISRAIGTEGAVPTDGLQAAALKAEYGSLYKEFRQNGLDPGKAAEQTSKRLGMTWGRSDVGGGQLMRHPPERYAPEVAGSREWMRKGLEADIEAVLGKPRYSDNFSPGRVEIGKENWSYRLLSDPQTEADIGAGRQPSYVVMVDNKNTGQIELPLQRDGRPMRYRFDATAAQNEDRAAYEEKRAGLREFERNSQFSLGVP